VSKLFTNTTDAVLEKVQAEGVRAIDPTGRFSITPLKMCKSRIIRKSMVEPLCPRFTATKFPPESIPMDSIDMLIYPNGGMNLERCALSGLYSKRTLITALSRIITEGLPKMAEAQFMHMDIKLDNIVLQEVTVAKLIDFGVASTFARAVSPKSHIFTTHQTRFPPELYVMQFSARRGETQRHEVLHYTRPEVWERIGLSSEEATLGKFGRELKKLGILSGKSLSVIYADLFVDTYDLYSLAWSIADILANPSFKFIEGDAFEEGEYQKLMIWLQNILASNAFSRWNAAESAKYWPNIWKDMVSVEAAQKAEIIITRNARVRMSKAIKTKVFGGALPEAYVPVDLYKGIARLPQSSPFAGAVGYARGGTSRSSRPGSRLFTRSKSRSESQSRTKSRSRSARRGRKSLRRRRS